jgi:hypothetical protein
LLLLEHGVFQQQQKCGGEKAHKGALAPTGFFRSPSRRKAAKQLLFVMRRYLLHFLIFY